MDMKIKKIISAVIIAITAVLGLMLCVSAGTSNPFTGDSQGKFMPIVLGALGVSLVVIIVIALMSGKKKK